MLLPRMLDDAFKITLDPLFYGSVSSAKFKVDGYPDSESMWLNLNIEKWSCFCFQWRMLIYYKKGICSFYYW